MRVAQQVKRKQKKKKENGSTAKHFTVKRRNLSDFHTKKKQNNIINIKITKVTLLKLIKKHK